MVARGPAIGLTVLSLSLFLSAAWATGIERQSREAAIRMRLAVFFFMDQIITEGREERSSLRMTASKAVHYDEKGEGMVEGTPGGWGVSRRGY